jgi:hypothetical protein
VTTDEAVKEALSAAYAVVRGAPLDATVKKDGPVVFTYTRFAISETLHGAPSDVITVRQPGAGEENAQPLVAGEDVVLVLDAPGSDKAYPIHDYPAGRYRVLAVDGGGEMVVVSADGIDTHFLSPKDKRPRSADELVTVDHFRVLAGAPSWEAPSASASAASTAPPVVPPIANATTTTTSAPQRDAPGPVKTESGASFWWLGVAIAIVVALVALRSARRR